MKRRGIDGKERNAEQKIMDRTETHGMEKNGTENDGKEKNGSWYRD